MGSFIYFVDGGISLSYSSLLVISVILNMWLFMSRTRKGKD
mgnify:CR=1 FL=1